MTPAQRADAAAGNTAASRIAELEAQVAALKSGTPALTVTATK